MKKRKIIACDFDGTIATDEYPCSGKPIWRTINYLKAEKEKGAILILWTCRVGDYLHEAVEFCKIVGLDFDYINENCKENITMFNGGYTRKIYADEYIDDKAVNIKDL